MFSASSYSRDMKVPAISWRSNSVTWRTSNRSFPCPVDYFISQKVEKAIRENAILDTILTSRKSHLAVSEW